MSVARSSDLLTAQRIVVYGVTGSGKSTLSALIAERRGLPHIPTDELGWGPDWTALDPVGVDALMDELTSGDAWVADSFWGRTTADLVPKIDLMIGLDLPRWLTFARLVRRTARRIRTRELVCNGNVETLPRALGRDSILRWHARTWRSKAARIRTWEADPAAPPVLRVTRPREVAALVALLDVR